MKKFIGFAAAGFLTVSIGAQVLITQHELNVQEQHFNALQTQLKQQTAHQVKLQKQMLAMEINTLENEVWEKTITEEFVITELDGKYVRGELTEGTGEGIYYHNDFFEETVGKVDVGDKVAITWTKEAYDNGDWENIANIDKIK